MIFGMDTLLSQAYGAGNYKLVSVYTQNALFLVTLASIPVVILWLLTERNSINNVSILTNFTEIMLLIGQPAAIAAKAGLFAMCLLPGLLPYMYFSVTQHLFYITQFHFR